PEEGDQPRVEELMMPRDERLVLEDEPRLRVRIDGLVERADDPIEVGLEEGSEVAEDSSVALPEPDVGEHLREHVVIGGSLGHPERCTRRGRACTWGPDAVAGRGMSSSAFWLSSSAFWLSSSAFWLSSLAVFLSSSACFMSRSGGWVSRAAPRVSGVALPRRSGARRGTRTPTPFDTGT